MSMIKKSAHLKSLKILQTKSNNVWKIIVFQNLDNKVLVIV